MSKINANVVRRKSVMQHAVVVAGILAYQAMVASNTPIFVFVIGVILVAIPIFSERGRKIIGLLECMVGATVVITVIVNSMIPGIFFILPSGVGWVVSVVFIPLLLGTMLLTPELSKSKPATS